MNKIKNSWFYRKGFVIMVALVIITLLVLGVYSELT